MLGCKLKWLKIASTVLAVVLWLPLLAFVLCNQFDEKLSPEAQALLDDFSHRAMPPAGQNAFYAMLGFRAPQGQDPWQAGKHYWDAVDRYWKIHPPTAQTMAGDFLVNVPEVTGLPVPDLPACSRKEVPCLFELAAKARLSNPASLYALEKQYAAALQRYRALRSYPDFASPEMQSNPLLAPYAHLPQEVRQLWRLSAGFRLSEGLEIPATLDEIAADRLFWSKQAQVADSLISKISAHTYLQQNYRLLAEAAYSSPGNYLLNRADWDALLAPLPGKVFEMAAPLQREQVVLMQTLAMMETANQPNSVLDKLYYKFSRLGFLPNATLNEVFRVRLPWKEAQDVPAILANQQADRRRFEARCDMFRPTILYNPAGKILNCIGNVEPSTYALKIWRTEATRRLVAEYLYLLRAQVDWRNTVAVSNELAHIPSALRNPWDQKPARFEAQTGELVFDWGEENGKPASVRLLVYPPGKPGLH